MKIERYRGKHENQQQYKRNRKITLMLNLSLALIIIMGASLWYLINHAGSEKSAREAMGNLTTAYPSGDSSSAKNSLSSPAQSTAFSGNDSYQTTSPETTPSPTPQTLTLSMVGDMLLHAPVSRSGRERDGSYEYDSLFTHVKNDISASDVALINEEVLLAGEQFGISGYPSFNGRFEVADAIENAGFDVVLHATNHSMDKGKQGLLSCLKNWRKNHPEIKVTGMYDTKKKAEKITYVKKNGICLAILNYTYGTNGLPLPSDMPYAVNLLTRERVKADVKKARKKADFIIVCPHWGTEYYTGISEAQKEWSEFFLRLKVDLVIGTHPHVIEPVKWLKGKNGHKMLVYYSLGNYVNASSRRDSNVYKQFCGGMAKVTIQKDTSGKTRITEAGFVPLITHWKYGGKISTYLLADYTRKKAEKNHLAQISSGYSYDNVVQFFRKTISKKFLTEMPDSETE